MSSLAKKINDAIPYIAIGAGVFMVARTVAAAIERRQGTNGIGATRRAKYKLIVEGDFSGQLTGEYENLAANLKDAEAKAKALYEEYKTPVACYEIDEDVRYPYGDYRIWVKDSFGDQYWKWMKVSDTGGRLYTYIKGWKL